MEKVDEFDLGFGWIADEFMERCSHALVADGRTWLIDPVDASFAEVGNPAGVIQLLDRHNRDCARIANRLGVPHYVVPKQRLGSFEFLPVVARRKWQEVALWWPEARVLVAADAFGTAAYFRASRDRLAVHPLLRVRPPRLAVQPRVLLCGHGAGIFEEADRALEEAIRTSRRRMPAQLVNAVRAWRARRSS